MPELPEVETTLRGLAPFLQGQTIAHLHVREPRLRWPVSEYLISSCSNQPILDIKRRAKYLLLRLSKGHVIIHLGMTGTLRVLNHAQHYEYKKHDHLELTLTNGHRLRYNDPRRFGFWLFTDRPLATHPLLKPLGPEPLSEAFDAQYLLARAKNRKKAIKSFIMDNHIVVGVGNIYATESLFFAGIHPNQAAGHLTRPQADTLVRHIKQTLQRAIDVGGTTLRDFYATDGKPGYFAQSLKVYGRAGQPCEVCQTVITTTVIGNRASAFCPVCQAA